MKRGLMQSLASFRRALYRVRLCSNADAAHSAEYVYVLTQHAYPTEYAFVLTQARAVACA